MSENTTIPSLTLTPQEDEAAAAAAAQETAVPEAPTLTLTPEATDAASAVQNSVPAQIDESMLSEAERKIVDEFSKKIDLTDSTQVLQYGTAAQKNIASFSENALNNVRTKDLGEIGRYPVQPGGGAEEHRAGRREKAGLFPAQQGEDRRDEGPVRQGGGQRGQDLPDSGAASGAR